MINEEKRPVTLLGYTLGQMRHHLQNQPEFLFETWGCPSPHPYEAVFADLIGLDDEYVEMGLRIKYWPEILMPLRSRPSLMVPMDDPLTPMIRVARYKQLNSFSRMLVDVDFAASADESLKGLPVGPNFQHHIVLLRYKRAL